MKKPANRRRDLSGGFVSQKPPLALPESDFDDIINESVRQMQQPGGLFLEEKESKTDTIKRRPTR